MFPLINVKETAINLRRIMDKRNLTVKDVQRYLGLGSVQSVYHWLNGLTMPTIDNLYALSDLLRVPIDEIVCGNRSPIVSKSNTVTVNTRYKRLFIYYTKINRRCVAGCSLEEISYLTGAPISGML